MTIERLQFNTSLVAVARYPRNAEGRVRDFLLTHSNYSARDRPVLNPNDTVYVGLRMELYAMLDLYWTDQRLTWDPADFEGEDLLVMYPDEIWIPKVFLSNSIGYFPFDTQKCPFYFLPENHIAEHMVLVAEKTPHLPQLESLEWDLLNVTASNFDFPVPNWLPNRDVSWYTQGTVCVFLKRDANYYISTLILPSTLMCILAFVTFLAPPDSGERVSLDVSMVLGLTVFQLLIADLLPTSSTRTPVLSKYLTCNFVLACLAVPCSLMNINIAYGDNKLRLLKYTWIRELFLEYLPCCLSIPSYRDRVRCEILEVKKLEMNNEANTGYDLGVIMKNAVDPIRQPVLKDQLSNSEKVKLEARTVALVMDRLVLITFLIAFAVFVIIILVDYGNMPDVTFDNLAVARYPKNAEGRVRDFLLRHSNYSTRDRPVLNSNDTVYVALQMEMYAMLDLYWTDQRLTWNPDDFEGEDLLVILSKDALGTAFTDRGSIELTSDGFVLYGMPMFQSTQCPMNIPSYHDRVRREVKGAMTLPGMTNDNVFVMSNNAVESNEEYFMEDRLRSTDKIKLEARTFALVMDRLVLVIFLIAFVGYVIKILLEFGNIPQVTSNNCPAT
ncbi:Neuronal acetylcholine receptor subunit beta-3 [Holothuria leucospilota]|uniref:Neuronal acetylcholine receptor subunit beta-3 n=1 Tax=Holothuria leucospilota TaxID=206669 RepID=A0A9Q1H3W6_HOLLE|nr:Neuronal acetylcholine receptor subunit beta-3 [Holothuria leucospilota]